MKTSRMRKHTVAAVAGLLAAFGLSANAQLAHYYYKGGGATITNDQVGSATGTPYGTGTYVNANGLYTDGSDGGLSGGVPSNGMLLDSSAVSGITGAFAINQWFTGTGNGYTAWLFGFSDGTTANMLACLEVDNWWPKYPAHAYTGIGGSYTDVWGDGFDNGLDDGQGSYGSWTDDGATHMMTLTYDGSSLTMYVDTQLAGSAALSGFNLSLLTTPVVAGGSPWTTTDRAANADTHSFAIYGDSLAAWQVANIYGLGQDATVSEINAALIPEPSVLALSGLGGLALLMLRRRAKH